jgi:hypothetical protein
VSEREFFRNNAEARGIYRAIRRITDDLAGVRTRVSKSQIGFYRERGFASVWIPSQYLEGKRPPLVLTLFLPQRIRSHRWKEVSEPKPGRFTHHMELSSAADVDEEVRGWIIDAWREAA